MFILTDEVIKTTISNTSGLIVATIAEQSDLSIERVSELYLNSNTFTLLRNKETGYYWDSIAELIDMFSAEVSKLVNLEK